MSPTILLIWVTLVTKGPDLILQGDDKFVVIVCVLGHWLGTEGPNWCCSNQMHNKWRDFMIDDLFI